MSARAGFLVLGNQLFAIERLEADRDARFLMIEDEGFCGAARHHKQRLTMVLAAMRAYRDDLTRAGFTVDYHPLAKTARDGDPSRSFEATVARWLERHRITQLTTWEIPGKALEARVRALAAEHGVPLTLRSSPMFLCERPLLLCWFRDHAAHMASFYRFQRKRLGILLDASGEPTGGQWSFDADNRKRLPRNVAVPGLPRRAPPAHVREVAAIVARRFAGNPGELDLERWWAPTTRQDALAALEDFVSERLAGFGPYEDALSTRDPFLFHSTLSAPMNLGLLTPSEVLARALEHAKAHRVPLSSLEGFVRQVIGWREFVHGVYRCYSERQAKSNFFGHTRKLTARWYDGTTGLLPLDHAIQKAQRFGWTHHIERLMVVANLMTLCEVEPREAHRWFMELYLDASAWVMGPNVYGMGTFADGGIFATKPYLCGSNYVLKMSDYGPRDRGPWCEIMDGLYWRFIAKHRAFFTDQARLGYAVQTLDRMDAARRDRIFGAADAFIARVTA